MGDPDPRHAFIVQSACDALGLPRNAADADVSGDIRRFLDDYNSGALHLAASPNGKLTRWAPGAPGDDDALAVHFVKRRPGLDVPASDVHRHILSTTLSGGEGLLLALQNVYSGDAAIEETPFIALQRSLLRGAAASSKARRSSADDDAVGDTRTLTDECAFWASRRGDARASAILAHLEPLAERMDGQWASEDDATAVLEDAQFALGEAWHDGLPQARAVNLLACVSRRVAGYVQAEVGKVDLWRAPWQRVRQALLSATRVAELWLQIGRDLVARDWAGDGRWTGPPPADDDDDDNGSLMLRILRRLRHIRESRALHDELRRLVPPGDAPHRAALDDMLAALEASGVALHWSAFAEPTWAGALAAFDRAAAPLEKVAAGLFRARIAALSSKPALLLAEFEQFPELLSRATAADDLASEREALLARMTGHVRALRVTFEARSGADPTTTTVGRNLGEAVARIVWASQIRGRAQQTTAVVSRVLLGVSGLGQLQALADDLAHDAGAFATGEFDAWLRDTQAALNDGRSALALQTRGSLIDLDVEGDGDMRVHYSERLVALLRDVRSLSELGYRIPADVQLAAETGDRFYRYAVQLQQVANFYNTMAAQILPSQKPMLLAEAHAFEAAVQSRAGATWDSPDQLEAYVGALMQAADALTSKNRRLRAAHGAVAAQVVALFATDLARWPDLVTRIQGLIDAQERANAPPSMVMWRRHWDHQLFKALSVAYTAALANVPQPELKADLVWQQRALQLRPGIEDLRLAYVRHVRRVVAAPTTFRGADPTNPDALRLYASLAAAAAPAIVAVFAQGESTWAHLRALVDAYQDWVAPGALDVQDQVDAVLPAHAPVARFAANLDDVDERRREASRIPEVVRVGPVTVAMASLRSAVDDIVRRVADAVGSALRRSITTALGDLERFADDVDALLTVRPQSSAEVASARASWAALVGRRAALDGAFGDIDARNALFRGVDERVHVSPARQRWDAAVIGLDAFGDLLADSATVCRDALATRARTMKGDLDKLASRWMALRPTPESLAASVDDDDAGAAERERVRAQLGEWRAEVSTWERQAADLQAEFAAFDLAAPDLGDALARVAGDLGAVERAWAVLDEFGSALARMTSEAWVEFRAHALDLAEFAAAWKARARALGAEHAALARAIRDRIVPVDNVAGAVRYLTGELFEKEHWAALFHRLAFPKGVTLATLRLSHFLAAHVVVVEQTPALKELAGRAQGEVALREAFEEMRAWADQTEFELTGGADQGGGGVALIRGWKDVMTQAGDQQAMLASLRDSPYFAPFADLAAQIERRLTTLDGALHRLNGIQRRWVYLAPIFGRGALPNEQGRFARVDDDFRALMASIARNRNVMALTAMAGLDDRLASMADQLDRCQRALAEFLEAKRSLFPRFYFIGDDALLEILGQADNPAVIQSHLKKLFQGIDSVRFDGPAIVAMVSGDGEVVNLRAKVALSADVDEWLSRLADEMRKTLAGLLVDCVATTTTTAAVPPTMAWIDRFPSQILSLADQIRFTADVEQAIRASKGGSTSFASLRSARMARLADLTRAPAANAVQDLKVKALVIEMVHHVEVLEVLEREQVRDTNAWPWQKQLRFYLDEQTRQCVARMCSARFDYTYEYQGNAPRLVHTPLTDKCYLVLTQGMFLGYGGNPYGPAGTGKTESVKALGQALGRQVLVFNCDEGIDFQGMGRIFTGLVKSGAWGCFDEFNRLKEDQLSAVSQQIQVIQAALKGRQSHVDLLGAQINVDPNAGIFVTMNPAGKEYGGRSRLPDNLKALFRSVAMTAPDNVLIAEVVLYSEGFTHARMLGAKLVSVYDLARQLLSPQRHYDWGLRALKAVLRLAGQLFSRERHAHATAGSTRSEDVEKRLVVQALRASTLSKLAAADAGRFRALIGDLFPGTAVGDVDNADLARAIEAAAQARHLEVVPGQVRKALQLYDALSQRMGVVVVGPSGCGKSTLLAMLGDALGILGRPVRRIVLNPKSMERTALLGHMDVDTREWTDGVLTRAARQVVADPGTTFWIVCDGDVDPEWIESLNSVLDDNHLLTMPNGERLQFGSNVNFVFETADLEFASPATVSRMGMILVGDDDLDVRAIVASWLKRLPDDSVRRVAADSIDDLFYRAITQAPHAAVPCSTAGVVQAALSHVGDARSRVAFAVGLARGLGANMSTTDRRRLASEVFGWSGDRALHDAGGDPLHVTTDAGSSIRRFERIDGEVTLGAPVLTAELQANLATLTPWIRQGQPFVVVGPEGCGKSLLVRAALQQAGFAHATLHCSAQTRAVHVVQRLRDVCTTVQGASGRVLRPARGDRLVVFLKDINLARPDKYGTIELIALLTQIVTHGGFYDRVDNELEFVRVEGVIIGASLSQSAGRHALSLRFTSVVRILVVDYPSKADLEAICTSYLAPIVRAAASADSGRWGRPDAAHALAVTMTDFYATVRATFPADTNRHYVFTPRDLTGWAKALLRYDLSREHLLEVFANEACRTFRDRLVDRNAQERFDTMLAASLGERWGFKIDDPPLSCFSSLLSGTPSSGGGSGPSDIGPVLQRVTMTDLQALVSDGLRSYEREYRPLDIVMFPEMLMALANTDRVLSAPGGSILCVGPSGVGRRSILQLLCHMRSLHLFTPPVSRSYTARQFDGDLKDLMRRAGVDGEHVVLLLQEHQLVHAHMLESVNSLLSSGQIPGLYTGAEFDAVLQSGGLRELAAAQATPVPVADLFAQRVLRNLHIALLMDPQHPEFVSRLTSNPALLHRCTILWRATWTNAAIRALLQARLRHVLLETRPGQRGDDDDADGLVDANHPVVQRLIAMHDWAGTRSAPQKLIALVDTYTQVLASERGRLQGKRRFLALGLDKLREAESLVATLSGEAVQKQRALQAKQVEADAALQSISESMSAASERRLEVQALQSTLGDKEERLRARKVEVEKELSEIAPVLDASREAVGSIRKEALAEMRALRMPPEAVHDVLSGVLMFMGNDDVSWNSMKRLLASATFKEEIVNFDARRASRETREKVKALLAKKESSFDHKTIYRVNVAAAPLAAWVQANVRYADVLERIAPLEADLNAANAALASSRSRLQACVEELQKLDSSVQTLKVAFARTTSEAEALRLGLQSAQEILNRAQSLLGQLGDEKARWTRDHGRLDALLNDLPSQVVTAAAFIAYLGGRPEDDRRLALESWKSERGAEPFSLPRFLATASETISWKEQGLSGDALSVENAIVIVRSRQTPFVIDPARQAERWLESRLHAEHRPVEVLVNNDPRFSSVLELSVRFGKSLVIKDVDGIEPALYPLLRRDLVRQGPRWVVPVGDKLVDFSDDFALYLVTRRTDIQLTPTDEANVNVVNFTVTFSGLQSQLLSTTLAQEEPELEKKKTDLLRQEDCLHVQLADLERKLLEELATSEGNILENKTLAESLQASKARSTEIQTGLENARQIQASLDSQRMAYQPIADTGARLFFLVDVLYHTNPMYRFSLNSFIAEFLANITDQAKALSASDKAERIARFSRGLIGRVYRVIAQSLFKDDRLTFAMHLARGLRPDLIDDQSWSFLIGVTAGPTRPGTSRPPTWLPADRHAAYASLAQAFPDMITSLSGVDVGAWQSWVASPRCENDLPPALSKALNPAQRLLVLAAVRPDRLHSAMVSFACNALGLPTASPSTATLNELLRSPSPVLFVTSPGADPTRDIEELAESSGVPLVQIAMGQGQTDAALKAISTASSNGSWVCLKNLHLVSTWLPTLEKALGALSKCHERYRLWLTSESHACWPAMLLQRATKVTVEAPPGVKRNLLSTYSMWNDDFVGKGNDTTRARLLFCLAWFHALVQERRIYIPQGWTKFYEFSLADLRAGADIIDGICSGRSAPSPVPWPTIYGLMQDAVYGGRIDNAFDCRVLRAYIENIFRDDVDLGPSVRIPSSAAHGDFLRVIRSLPDTDSPLVFGLPENVEGSVQRQRSAAVLGQLKTLHHALVSAAHADRYDRDAWRALLSPVMTLWRSSPRNGPTYGADTPPGDDASPLVNFLNLEKCRVTNLAAVIDSSLGALYDLVWSGTGIRTSQIEADARALMKGSVPSSWSSIWASGPENASAFVSEVISRQPALASWADRLSSNSLLSAPLRLAHLFHPAAFLNAFRQETARQLQLSIDSLRIVCALDRTRVPRAASPVMQVEGLLLQGAAFTNGQLSSLSAQSPLLQALPLCYIAFVDAAQPDPYNDAVQLPLYESTTRDKVVSELKLPCSGDARQWILAGAAIFLTDTSV